MRFIFDNKELLDQTFIILLAGARVGNNSQTDRSKIESILELLAIKFLSGGRPILKVTYINSLSHHCPQLYHHFFTVIVFIGITLIDCNHSLIRICNRSSYINY